NRGSIRFQNAFNIPFPLQCLNSLGDHFFWLKRVIPNLFLDCVVDLAKNLRFCIRPDAVVIVDQCSTHIKIPSSYKKAPVGGIAMATPLLWSAVAKRSDDTAFGVSEALGLKKR